MTPRTIAKIRNLEAADLPRVIERVRSEKWADESAREAFLKALEDEHAERELNARRVPRR